MSSGFVTESEITEARKKRQEEWEKVRQPDQPLERPEEPYDGRSLFDRLKEQRDKKDLDFEESHKLKNLVRGLDNDEINFLDIVDKAKADAEKRQQLQEDNELSEFRERVASLQEQHIDKKISAEKAIVKPKAVKTATRPSQKSFLLGVVRKRPASDSADAKPDNSNESTPAKNSKLNGSGASTDDQNADKDETDSNTVETDSKCDRDQDNGSNQNQKIDLSVHNTGAMKCIGILPGIGKYRDSSDSEKSTDTDDDYDFSDFDWVGRKVKKSLDDCHD